MKYIQKVGLFAVAGLLAFSACKKENTFEENNTINRTTDSSQLNAVYNRTVNYTVLVTNQREGSFRSAEGVAGATVAVSVDGTVQTATTDANGQAVFTGLKYGSAGVTVSAPSHTAAHYIVDFTSGVDEDVDNHTQRTASTLVRLLPVADLGTATLRGRVEVERDATQADLEALPENATSFTARVNFFNFDGNGSSTGAGGSHNGAGRITEFYYEGVRGTQNFPIPTAAGSRDYSITLPATAYGLSVQVWANPYIGTYTPNVGDPETRTFNLANTNNNQTSPRQLFSGTAYPGAVYVRNAVYNRQ